MVDDLQENEDIGPSSNIPSALSPLIRSKVNLDGLPSNPADRQPIASYYPNQIDDIRRAYLVKKATFVSDVAAATATATPFFSPDSTTGLADNPFGTPVFGPQAGLKETIASLKQLLSDANCEPQTEEEFAKPEETKELLPQQTQCVPLFQCFDDVNSPDISGVCGQVLTSLSEMHGCEIVEITIPELQKMRIAHIVSDGSEALCSLMPRFLERNFQKLALDSRINLAVIQSFTGSNYVAAQRLRWRLMYYHMEIFKKVDIIVTPSTGMTAPKIHPSALACGELDLEVTASLMKYGLTANVLGFPAISVPVGYDKQGLPIGLQLIGRPWCEATILRLAAVIEQQWNEPKRKPVIYFDVTNTKGK
ncbi:fatty acid amide hydrolase-like [Bidens hawaiensis]|uniref:fatty acid amide hydrolase-like n=1 Tax=Bidens hawaiensis TaxID=980011 RepID=UPI0040492ADD